MPTARTAFVTWYTSLRSVGVVLVEEHPHPFELVRVDQSPMNAAPTVTSDSRLIVKMYRALAPATSSTPIAIAMSTEAEPRSGWTMSSTAGTPTISSPPRKRA